MKKLEREEAKRLVDSMVRNIYRLRDHALKGIDGRQAWLVWGRTMAAVFNQHFGISLDLADEELEKCNG